MNHQFRRGIHIDIKMSNHVPGQNKIICSQHDLLIFNFYLSLVTRDLYGTVHYSGLPKLGRRLDQVLPLSLRVTETLSRETTLLKCCFFFCFLLKRVPSCGSTFFHFRVDIFFHKEIGVNGKQTESHKSCLSCQKWRNIYHLYLFILNIFYYQKSCKCIL